jgi:ankyrin repeat protein
MSGAHDFGMSQPDTPLHLAASAGHKDLTELLLANHADVNTINSDGAIPLHAAASRGCKHATELLLDRQADINAKDHNGWTPLFFAALDKKRMLEFLLANEAEVNARGHRRQDGCALRSG